MKFPTTGILLLILFDFDWPTKLVKFPRWNTNSFPISTFNVYLCSTKLVVNPPISWIILAINAAEIEAEEIVIESFWWNFSDWFRHVKTLMKTFGCWNTKFDVFEQYLTILEAKLALLIICNQRKLNLLFIIISEKPHMVAYEMGIGDLCNRFW